MVNRELFDLFNTDSTEKQLRIEFDGGVITNEELHSQSFELTESLCSEKNLRFGCCEASSIKFKLSNIFTPLKDKWLTVTITLNGDSTKKMTIGKYKVYSDVPTADRRFRDVVAYDSMYDIINSDVSAWYDGLTFPMTMKTFRSSFVSYFGLTEETVQLVNDGMTIEKTVEPSEMSGRDVITSICELNGVFGHIGRDGKFKYIDIAKYVGGLYPADDLFPDKVPDYLSQGKNEHLYPQGEGENSQRVTRCENYISCQYEDYIVQDITKLQIREKEGDIGVIEGDGDNTYVIQDNFLVYGKSSDELHPIAERLFQMIRGAIYRPFSADVKGCPCFEVGDFVQFQTRYAVVSSYILKRTLKGIQALRDDFSADGEMLQPEKVNDIHTSIIQLKGKSNMLERTIEETNSTIRDVEAGLQSQITQTATEIRAEVEDTANGLSSRITQNADSIVLSVDDNGKVVAVQLAADRSTGTTNFTVGADNISLEGKTINLTSDDIAIESTNFSVDKNGTVTAKNINITGGVITWSDIDTSGLNIPTSNDISNISKTTITKDYIETLQVKAGSVDAENITGTTISGKTISGGTVASEDIIVHNQLYMQYKYGDYTGQKIPVFIMNTAEYPATLQIGKSTASLAKVEVYSPTEFYNDVFVDKSLFLSGALWGKNIHADGGHYYARALEEDGGDGAEHGVLELENSTYTRDNVQYSVFSCCVGYSGYPTVLRGTEVRLKNAGGTVVSSDERIKNSFKSLDEFVAVYMDLEPCAFKYNNGTSDRFHFGFKAQNVENALLNHGYTTKDFAGFVQSYEKEGTDGYCGVDDPKGLIYTEFVAWNTHMIQNHEREIRVLKFRVDEQEKEISTLQSKVNDLEQKIEMLMGRLGIYE